MAKGEDNVERLKQAYRLWHDSKGSSADHWLGLMAEEVDFRSLAQGAEPMAFTASRHSKD